MVIFPVTEQKSERNERTALSSRNVGRPERGTVFAGDGHCPAARTILQLKSPHLFISPLLSLRYLFHIFTFHELFIFDFQTQLLTNPYQHEAPPPHPLPAN